VYVLRSALWALALLLAGTAQALGPGDAAPDFTLTGFDGKVIHLAEFRGRVVLLNFWASWCAPCLEEMPRFSAWQRRYGEQGLQVIGISMDDNDVPVRQVLVRQPVEYPIAVGDVPLAERYGRILGLPQSFLIARDGRILARYKGEVDLAQLEKAIVQQLP
jgi:cytochrome c biogenesis protein CcmG, thiol:disulfide interchange protein DsbE